MPQHTHEKQWIPNGGSGYYRCKVCKEKLPQHTLANMEERFDEKFPYRIYGVAGEPKTEFLDAKNKPDEIKAFINSEISLALKAQAEEIEREVIGMKVTDGWQFTPDRVAGKNAYNKALNDILAIICKHITNNK